LADYKTAREIFRGHFAEAGEVAARRVRLRPDALALGGEDALRALEEAGPGAGGSFDVERVILFAGECRGRGSARLAPRARAQAGAFGFRLVHPAAGCAVPVLFERGLAGPGDLVAALGLPGGQTSGNGSLVWAVEGGSLPGILEDGTFDVDLPDVHRIECRGELGPATSGVDVGLYVASQFGREGARGALLEFGGAVVEALGIGEREGLADAAVLCGPAAVLCAPGTKASGSDAYFEYDFTNLKPQYAASKGTSAFDVGLLADASAAFVGRVLIGPAAAAAELRDAARLLAGKRIHSDVQLWVSPASRQAHFESLAKSYLMELVDAGATLLPSCTLPWAEELASDGAAVATTGFCGFEACLERDAEVYYVSAVSAAAAALAGELCDPTPLCANS
jgi:3-isopropylmalate/(R)-2-methylmalate dehydratase large subunit